MRSDSGSLRSGTFEGARHSRPLTGPQSGANPSTPLSHMQSDAAASPHFSGSIAPPQSGPLRQSGPLVDGRTSVSGPVTSGSLSSSHLSSKPLSSVPLSTGSTSSGQLSPTGPGAPVQGLSGRETPGRSRRAWWIALSQALSYRAVTWEATAHRRPGFPVCYLSSNLSKQVPWALRMETPAHLPLQAASRNQAL